MKTLINSQGEYLRVKNEDADVKVKREGWKFCSKKGWKDSIRVKPKEAIVETVIDKGPKKKFKKGTKQHA